MNLMRRNRKLIFNEKGVIACITYTPGASSLRVNLNMINSCNIQPLCDVATSFGPYSTSSYLPTQSQRSVLVEITWRLQNGFLCTLSEIPGIEAERYR